MSVIPNFTGRKVSIKSTKATGVIKETNIARPKGIVAVVFVIQIDDGVEVKLRPDEVDVLD
jgi:hypothetical protein